MSEGLVRYRDRLGRKAEVGYRRSGRGPAVTLIHGVGLKGSIWAPQIAALESDH